MQHEHPAPVETIEADIIIIGSGVVGGLAAYELAREHKVAVIDAGPRIDRVEAVERFRASPLKGTNAPYENPWYAPQPNEQDVRNYYIQEVGKGQQRFQGLFLRGVGGSSWHWTGHAERHYPNDFRMRSAYGVGVDWPIEYSEILPYYTRAEAEWGVAGDGTDYIGPDRHGESFPLPKVPMSYTDLTVGGKAATVDFSYTCEGRRFGPTRLAFGPYPHSRNSIPHDGRPQCCGNASCRFICPIAAKYDASVHVTKAEERGARVFDKRVVYHIEVGSDGLVTGLRYRHPDGWEGRAVGRRYILAAHAIETPKLLLMSTGEYSRRGVANSSDMVGRNLIGLADVNTQGYAPHATFPYRGPVSATGGLKSLRDGDFRATHGAIATNFVNGGWNATLGPADRVQDLIAQGLFGEALNRTLRERTEREVMLGSMVDVLPNPNNRIVPDEKERDGLGFPRPRITFGWDDYTRRGIEVARQMHREVFKALQGTITEEITPAVETAIIVGTTVMGRSPAASVVDPQCRAHDHRNLFIIGTGVYPTTGIVSPSLTAAALALRAADQIHHELSLG
ncbi:GMC family oxidoreductase [Azospirillum picis]|uniref:Choline dehydrogenase-like flavoprotein n=1 Tax=Azospirillum picis TaxID=488438 RepID=A0ABU0MLQ6_9PROT|nr:GMC family oxidoreductase [Azospirillum picis]MBP2300983.1 choline dehydrogenase-like flavoprotein [Azospirillum picis]MDQ0534397.1 choline dehydrogenase-like flavoprotein [Azospirillum picis]